MDILSLLNSNTATAPFPEALLLAQLEFPVEKKLHLSLVE